MLKLATVGSLASVTEELQAQNPQASLQLSGAVVDAAGRAGASLYNAVVKTKISVGHIVAARSAFATLWAHMVETGVARALDGKIRDAVLNGSPGHVDDRLRQPLIDRLRGYGCSITDEEAERIFGKVLSAPTPTQPLSCLEVLERFDDLLSHMRPNVAHVGAPGGPLRLAAYAPPLPDDYCSGIGQVETDLAYVEIASLGGCALGFLPACDVAVDVMVALAVVGAVYAVCEVIQWIA